MRWTVGITLTLFAAYLFVALRVTAPVGLWQDDGIYVATAQSLAQGKGYRHIELPGEPLQTKYPILYPAILAVPFLCGSAYPENTWMLLIPSALGAALLVSLSIYYWRQRGDAHRWLLIPAGVLSALSPVIWSHVRFCMTDLIYGAIAIAAMMVLERSDTPRFADRPMRRRWIVGIGAGLMALAVLTRGIGIALLGAALVISVYRKRFGELRTVLIVAALMLAPWYVRQVYASGVNGELQNAFLYRCELAYSQVLPEHISQSFSTIWQNVGRVLFGIGYFQLAIPEGFSLSALMSFGWRTVLFHLVCYLTGTMILIGFVQSLRRQLRLIHAYAISYAVLILAWPFEPYRFLIPWTPFLIYWGLGGVATMCDLFAKRFVPANPKRWTLAGVVGVSALVMALFVMEDARIAGSSTADFHLREGPVDWTQYDELVQWIRTNTPPDAIIASAQPAGIFLATGRLGHYFWPDHDTYRLSYGPDRSYRTLYAAPAASEWEFARREIRERLADVYRENGITHYVEHRGVNTLAGAVGEQVRAMPERFREVHLTSDGVYTVFVVDLRNN